MLESIQWQKHTFGVTCPVLLTWPTWWSYKTQGLWTPGLWAWVFCPACACRRAAWILCRWTFRGTKPAGRICYIRNHNKECLLVFTKPGDMAGLSHWIKHSRHERGVFFLCCSLVILQCYCMATDDIWFTFVPDRRHMCSSPWLIVCADDSPGTVSCQFKCYKCFNSQSLLQETWMGLLFCNHGSLLELVSSIIYKWKIHTCYKWGLLIGPKPKLTIHVLFMPLSKYFYNCSDKRWHTVCICFDCTCRWVHLT